MSVRVFYEGDAGLFIAQGERLAFIGYGKQGAAQAQNLRESSISEIFIGNREDAYKEAALGAGFRVMSAISSQASSPASGRMCRQGVQSARSSCTQRPWPARSHRLRPRY